MLLLVLLLACRPPDTVVPEGDDGTTGRPPRIAVDTAIDEVGASGPGQGDDDSSWIFRDDYVHEFEIELSEESYRALQRNPFSYVEGSFVAEGVRYEGVGIRLKGQSTFQPINQKPSFKVKFDFVDPERRFHGENGITLHNQIYDPSMMHEVLSTWVARSLGLPASRVGYAWMKVNGRDYGLYTVVETLNRDFLERWWEDTSGDLYESEGCDFSRPSCYDLEEDGESSTPMDFRALANEIYHQRDEEFYESIQADLDWEQVRRYLAFEIFLEHWDGYAYNVNNYWLYQDPSGGWNMVPWSLDLSFGWYPWGYSNCGTMATQPSSYSNGIMSSHCKSYEPCWNDIRDAVLELEEEIDALDIPSRVEELQELIEERVDADPKKQYGMNSFYRHVDCLHGYVEHRIEELAAQGW